MTNDSEQTKRLAKAQRERPGVSVNINEQLQLSRRLDELTALDLKMHESYLARIRKCEQACLEPPLAEQGLTEEEREKLSKIWNRRMVAVSNHDYKDFNFHSPADVFFMYKLIDRLSPTKASESEQSARETCSWPHCGCGGNPEVPCAKGAE